MRRRREVARFVRRGGDCSSGGLLLYFRDLEHGSITIQFYPFCPIAVSERTFAPRSSVDHRAAEPSVFPLDIQPESAASAQAGYRSIRPCVRQSRQEIDFPGMALQKHFRDAGGGAEVAVDLKGRMRVEEIGIKTAAGLAVDRRDGPDQPVEQSAGAIPVTQPRPKIDFPREAPAGARVSAQFQ